MLPNRQTLAPSPYYGIQDLHTDLLPIPLIHRPDKSHLQTNHINQNKVDMLEPAFRFFSVHYFFLPSLIQPQSPPRKLESDSAAVFLESLIFFTCLLLSYILTNKSRTIFAKIQQSLQGSVSDCHLLGPRY